MAKPNYTMRQVKEAISYWTKQLQEAKQLKKESEEDQEKEKAEANADAETATDDSETTDAEKEEDAGTDADTKTAELDNKISELEAKIAELEAKIQEMSGTETPDEDSPDETADGEPPTDIEKPEDTDTDDEEVKSDDTDTGDEEIEGEADDEEDSEGTDEDTPDDTDEEEELDEAIPGSAKYPANTVGAVMELLKRSDPNDILMIRLVPGNEPCMITDIDRKIKMNGGVTYMQIAKGEPLMEKNVSKEMK